MKIFKSIVLLAILSVVACKKDETTTTTDNTVLLTTGVWKLTAETTGGVNTFAQLPTCSKDDTWAYATTGKVTIDEGATKCDPTDPQSETLNWSFTDATKKKFSLTDGILTITIDVLELTSTALKLQYTDPLTNLINVSTYSH